MADFNLYLGQDVKLTSDNNSSLHYKAEVIAKDRNSFDLKVLNEKQEKAIADFKRRQNWTLAYEGINSVYQLDVQIKTLINKPNLVLIVTPVAEMKKIERRRYRRAKVESAVEYHKLGQQQLRAAHLLDISASGIKMEVDNITDLQVENKVMVNFKSLTDFPLPEIKGRILRIKVNQNTQGQKRKYYIGLEFVGLTASEREKIIDWVQHNNKLS